MNFAVNSVPTSDGVDVARRGAIVLCGGKSTRMGRDKATLPFGPELMLQRVVRLLSDVVNPSAIVIVAAPCQLLPQLPDSALIARDEHPERGPLEGLAAGLRAMPPLVEVVYATSCDVPLLVPDFVEAMFLRLGDYEIAVPFDGQYHHPLAAVYRSHVLKTILQLLKEDRLRPRFLFDELRTVEVSTDALRSADPTLQTLTNLNHPEDYAAALAMAGFSAS